MKEYLKEIHIFISSTHMFWRITIITLILLVYGYFRYKLKNKKISKEIWLKKLINEFLYPIIILLALLIIENLILQRKELNLSLSSPIDWILVQKFFLEILFELIFELIPIYLTFIIFYFIEVRIEYKKERKREEYFWSGYVSKLNEALEIKALNVRDYSNFFVPLGMRYFTEQIRLCKTIPPFKNNNELSIFKRNLCLNHHIPITRFIVVPATSKDDLVSTEEFKATIENDFLNDRQRIFNNIFLLHKHHHIGLYLIPETELKELINGNFKPWILNIKKRRKIYKKLDRLLIKDSEGLYCWEVTDANQNTLIFRKEEDTRLPQLVKSVIEHFEKPAYCLYTLREQKIQEITA